MRRLALASPLLLVFLMLVPSDNVLAQTSTTSTTSSTSHSGTAGLGWQGWGARVGLSANPDQAYGGVHFNLGYFARDVRFRPTIEMGFGDDVTTIQALAEVHYIFSKVQVWKPYVGGGLGLAYVNLNDADPGESASDTEVSFAGMGGVETKLKSGSTFGIEGKIGFGDDDADFKFGVNWSF
jgi:opacity protein-like surface antigen